MYMQGKTEGSVATGTLKVNAPPDPTLFCCAYKRNRFYMFTRSLSFYIRLPRSLCLCLS